MKKRIFAVLLSVIMCIPSFMPVFADSADPLADYTIVDYDTHPEDSDIIVYYCDKNGDTNDAGLFVSKDKGTTKTLVREFKHEKEPDGNDGLVKFSKFDGEIGVYPLIIVLKDEEAYAQTGEGMGIYRSNDLGETIECIGYKGGRVAKITMAPDRRGIVATVLEERNSETGELFVPEDGNVVSDDNGLTWVGVTGSVGDTFGPSADFVEFSGEKVPASEYMHLTHTKVNDYIDNYHLTLLETIEKGLKGGEGFQLIGAFEWSDDDANYVVRGYDTAGVQYSKDGGETWHWEEDIKGQCYAIDIRDLEYYPGNPEILYSVRCSSGNGDTVTSGLYMSEDGGKTTERIYAYSHEKGARDRDGLIKFGAYDENLGVYPMYLVIKDEKGYDKYGFDAPGGQLGLFRSVDMGKTFECVGFKGEKVNEISMSQDGDFIVALVESRKNTETGKWEDAKSNVYYGEIKNGTDAINWQLRSGGIEEFTAEKVAIDTVDKNHWVTCPYLAMSEQGYPRLFETYDAGLNWTEIQVENWNAEHEDGTNQSGGSYGILKNNGSYLRDATFTYPDENGKTNLILCVGPNLWPYRISKDGGKNIQYINETQFEDVLDKDGTGWYTHAIAISKAAPSSVYIGQWRSDDYGNTFNWKDSGTSGHLAYDWLFDKETGQVRIVGGFDFGIFSAEPGYEGDYPPMQPSYRNNCFANSSCTVLEVDPDDPNHVWGLSGGRPYNTEEILVETYDGFKTSRMYFNLVKRLRERAEAAGTEGEYFVTVRYAKTNSEVIHAGPFISSDGGKTWFESELRIYAISPFNENVCYSMNNDEIMISYDRAVTWKGTGIKIQMVRDSFYADPVEDFVLWVGQHGYSGLHKVDLKTGSIKSVGVANGIKSRRDSTVQIRNVVRSEKYPDIIFVGGDDFYGYAGGTIFMSLDGGDTYEPIPSEISSSAGLSFKINPVTEKLWIASSHGNMVFDYVKYMNDKLEGVVE